MPTKGPMRKAHRVEVMSNTMSNLSPLRSQGRAIEQHPSMTVRIQSASGGLDKSSILWRDFLNGVSRRKRLLRQLKDDAGSVGTTPETIKQQMLELRQLTLRVIEDALEIEYRGKMKVDNVL